MAHQSKQGSLYALQVPTSKVDVWAGLGSWNMVVRNERYRRLKPPGNIHSIGEGRGKFLEKVEGSKTIDQVK